MTDYGKGGILSAASVLPATSGIGLFLTNNAHPFAVIGLFMISIISILVSVSAMFRYIRNTIKE